MTASSVDSDDCTSSAVPSAGVLSGGRRTCRRRLSAGASVPGAALPATSSVPSAPESSSLVHAAVPSIEITASGTTNRLMDLRHGLPFLAPRDACSRVRARCQTLGAGARSGQPNRGRTAAVRGGPQLVSGQIRRDSGAAGCGWRRSSTRRIAGGPPRRPRRPLASTTGDPLSPGSHHAASSSARSFVDRVGADVVDAQGHDRVRPSSARRRPAVTIVTADDAPTGAGEASSIVSNHRRAASIVRSRRRLGAPRAPDPLRPSWRRPVPGDRRPPGAGAGRRRRGRR